MSVADVDLKEEVRFEDFILCMKRPSFATEGEFVRWVRQRAFASAETIPDPDMRKEVLAGIAGDISSGKYDWDFDASMGGQNYVRSAFRSVLGFKHLVFLMFRQDTPMMLSDDGRKVFERAWKDEKAQGDMIDAWGRIMLPNRQTPSSLTQTKAEATTGMTEEKAP